MSIKVTHVADFDPEDELLPEYDLTKLKVKGRGLYAERYRASQQLVKLDADVWEFFNTDQAVNEALRLLIQLNALTQKSGMKVPA